MNDITLTLLELLLKASALLCLGFAVRFVWRGSSASQRSLAWLVVFAILGLLPASLFMQPVWPVPVALVTVQSSVAPLIEPAFSANAMTEMPATQQAGPDVTWSLADCLFVLYVFGAAAVMGYRLIGAAQLLRLRRRAQPVKEDSALCRIFEKMSPRRARLMISSQVRVPMTWGIWRPVVLLPADSESWREAELQAALQHELAHVRHRDPLRRWLGTLVCALWWPMPPVWLASRAWKLEQERACDDAVIRSGADPEAYAIQLLGTARQWQRHRFQTAAALVMAMPAGLETRLRSVVADTVNRASLSRAVAGVVMVCGVSIALLALGFRAQTMAAEPGKLIHIQAKFIEVDPAVTSWFALPTSGSTTLTEPQMQALLRLMSQTKGVELLSTPSIEAHPGQAAKVEVVREFGPPPVSLGKSDPPRLDLKAVGVMLDVTPHETEDGRVSLAMVPVVRDFRGFKMVKPTPGKQPEPVFAEATWKGTVPLRPREWYLQRLAEAPPPAGNDVDARVAEQAHRIRAENASLMRQKWVLVAAETVTPKSDPPSTKSEVVASEPTVTIYGEVKRQGKYTLQRGMTLDDLIKQAQGLSTAAANRADLWRGPKHAPALHIIELQSGVGFALQDGDRVTVHPKAPASKTTSSLREDVEAPFTDKMVGVAPNDETQRRLRDARAQLELWRKRSETFNEQLDRYDNTELNRVKRAPLNAADPDSMWRQQVDRANEVLRRQGLGVDGSPARARL